MSILSARFDDMALSPTLAAALKALKCSTVGTLRNRPHLLCYGATEDDVTFLRSTLESSLDGLSGSDLDLANKIVESLRPPVVKGTSPAVITSTTASYAKLRDGSWGLRIILGTHMVDGVDTRAPLRSGARVTVTKRDNTREDKIVGDIVGTFTADDGRRGYFATIGHGSLGAYRVSRDDNR